MDWLAEDCGQCTSKDGDPSASLGTSAFMMKGIFC